MFWQIFFLRLKKSSKKISSNLLRNTVEPSNSMEHIKTVSKIHTKNEVATLQLSQLSCFHYIFIHCVC